MKIVLSTVMEGTTTAIPSVVLVEYVNRNGATAGIGNVISRRRLLSSTKENTAMDTYISTKLDIDRLCKHALPG